MMRPVLSREEYLRLRDGGEQKEALGLLMLERSATKGYHLAFRRRPELSQEENLKWASELLGVKYDKGAKDITRVFFTTTADVTHNSVKQMLKNWKKQGLITQVEAGSYHKT